MFGGTLTLVSLAEAGKVVNKGDLVAEFDREEMLTRLDDFRSSVGQTETGLNTLRAQLAVLEKTHAQTLKEAVADVDKAQLDLKTIPVRSEIDATKYRLALEEAQATHKQLLNEVKMMQTSLQSQWKPALLARDEGQAELKRTEANVDRMVLRAPINGLVVMMTTVPPRRLHGARSRPAIRWATDLPIMQIVDLSSMIVNASVNQTDAELIRIGAKARVHFDAYPGLELPAEVYAIGAMPKGGHARRVRQRGSRCAPVAAVGQASHPGSVGGRGRHPGQGAADRHRAPGGDLPRWTGWQAVCFLAATHGLGAARSGFGQGQLRGGGGSLRPASRRRNCP